MMKSCTCFRPSFPLLRPVKISCQPLLQPGLSFLHAGHPAFFTRLVCRSSNMDASPLMTPDFHPSVWGNFFIDNLPPLSQSEEWMRQRANELKEEVSGLFEACDIVEKLNLVDTLQHLGIDHHFEDQILKALQTIHSADFSSTSLQDVSLRFRLLRHHGFWVSSDVFNIFKHADGSFFKDITNDPKGLLSLYNAAHLLHHNEKELEDAILFSRHHLDLMKSTLNSPLAEQVKRALQIPLPRTLKRVGALNYISEYNIHEATYNPPILDFARLDFNLLQLLHQKELKAISQWWEDLSTDIGLDYARDRVVECYFASYAVYYEQEHARARMILAKIFVLWTLLDDTYDAYATLEQCQMLNEAIQRWDEDAVSLLPVYLRKYFLNLMRALKEFQDELEPHQKYRGDYYKRAFQTLSHCYLQESEWFHGGYIPSFKEREFVSTISGGGQMTTVGLLYGMDDVATKETFDWAIGCTEVVKACGKVVRYMNDMAAFENGGNKMDVANSVECYMNEHNVTGEVALAKIGAMVEDAWKTINQARCEHYSLVPIVQRVSNFAMYTMFIQHEKGDAFTHNKDSEETIKIHFINPITF